MGEIIMDFEFDKPKEEKAEAGLEIGVVDINKTPKRGKLKLIMLIILTVILFLVIVIAVKYNSAVKNKQALVTGDLIQPSNSISSQEGGVPSSNTGESANSPDGSETATPSTKVGEVVYPSNSSISEGNVDYVEYKNGLIALSVQYPTKWYDSEHTSDYMGVLKASLAKGETVFSLKTGKLTDLINVVSFESDRTGVTVALSISPTSSSLAALVSGSTETKESLSLGDYKVELIRAKSAVFGENLYVSNMLFVVGSSRVVLTGHAPEKAGYAEMEKVMTAMVTSFKAS
jgi:flagellar basal body-associated protein FliL